MCLFEAFCVLAIPVSLAFCGALKDRPCVVAGGLDVGFHSAEEGLLGFGGFFGSDHIEQLQNPGQAAFDIFLNDLNILSG